MVTKTLPLRHTSPRLVSFSQIIYHLIRGLFTFFIPESFHQKNVKNQTVLITGSGSGIGQLMAVKFAKLGCRIVLWDVNEEGMRKTVEMIREKGLDTQKVFAFKIDLTDKEAIYSMAKKVLEEVGSVDILVNNAGVVSGYHLLDTPDSKIQLTFNVNVLAHFATIKAFLPEMIKRKRGHIVTIASAAGHVTAPKCVDYCASKFANVGCDLALRMELAQANLDGFIKTTIVKPYLISTGMFAGATPGILKYLKPEYVADSVVSGVLADKEEVVLPGYLVILFWLWQVLPHKALMAVAHAAGAFEAMDAFEGREGKKTVVNGEN